MTSTLSYLATPQKTGTHTFAAATVLTGEGSAPIPSAHLTVHSPTAAALKSGHLPPAVQRLRLRLEGLPGQIYVGQAVPIEIALTAPKELRIRAKGGAPQKIGENFRLGHSLDLPSEQVVELAPLSSGEGRWRTLLIATGSGELAVAFAAGLEVAEEGAVLEPGSTARNWEALFRTESRIPVALSSNRYAVSAVPLPTVGRPENFHGAIGKFSLQEPLVRWSTGGESAADVQVTVEGQGNFGTLTVPQLSCESGGRVLRQTRKMFRPADPLGFRGSVDFLYYLSDCRADGAPTFSFPYFDPERGRYECLTIPLWNTPTAKNGEEKD
jgi:hypothetical protein